MALVFEEFPVMLDLYSVTENKKGDTFFPPIGIAFLGEKQTEDGPEPKISFQLNQFPGQTFYGSLRKKRSNEPNF
jgi:hypothetical protein